MFNKAYPIIFTSLLIAMMLGMLPLPNWAMWIKPTWVLLVLLYWTMALPQIVGLFTAFFVGLIVDVNNASVLGVHALAMVCITYIALKFHQQIRTSPLLQQSLSILMLVAFYQLLLFVTQGMLKQSDHIWVYIFSPIISAMLWPWLYVLLRDVRRKFVT